MKPQIFVISGNSEVFDRLSPALIRCGLALKTASSADDFFLTRSNANRTICVVVDLPGLEGLHVLDTLRRAGVMAPAIIVAGAGAVLPPELLSDCGALDVLERPADKRTLLCWLECICVAQLAVARTRAAIRIAA